MLKIDRAAYESLDAAVRERVDSLLADGRALVEGDPLQRFWPHSPPQLRFMEALTAVVAAFAGNRFGKTTALVVKALVQCVPKDQLPRRLRKFKRFDGPTFGRICCPDRVATLEGVILPALRKWAPKHALKGGSFDEAYSKEFRTLHFVDGSWLQFMTYEMDVDKFGGAALHFVGYDEPPPVSIRRECLGRLSQYEGSFEMFACTPLKVNTGWMRREIWRAREAEGITVVKGSIHDNPLLDAASKKRFLDSLPDWERRAREFGDFMEFGGLIYPDFERAVLKESLTPVFVRGLDVVIGIDPGIRNAGIVWVGFDSDLDAYVFSEALLQNAEPKDYAKRIREENARLGLEESKLSFVIDPTARSRSQTNSETVMSLLAHEGIYCNPGQNDHEAGFAQMRTRMKHGRFHVDPACRGIQDEADDYAAREPEEGKDDSHMEPVRGNDHRLDACRYAVMERPWDPVSEVEAPQRQLGWQPGKAIPASQLQPVGQARPMGAMS